MRTVSASLLAAQRLAEQRPRVQLQIRDRRPFSQFAEIESHQTHRGAMAYNGSVILAAALDSSGNILLRNMPVGDDLPEDPGDWVGFLSVPTGWTTIVTGARGAPLGDVALGVVVGTGTWYLFYYDSTGRYLYCRTSTDVGVTWSAAATVHDYGGAVADQQFVAACGNGAGSRVWYARNTAGDCWVYFRPPSAGAWGAAVRLDDLSDGAEFGRCYGLAAIYDADGPFWVFAALDDDAAGADARIVMEEHGSTGVLEEVARVVPPGWGSGGWIAKNPAVGVATVGGVEYFFLTWWDSFSSGAMSWGHHRAMFSIDGQMAHWSYEQAVRVGASSGNVRRLNLAALGEYLYWWKANTMGRFEFWTSASEARNETVAASEIIRLQLEEKMDGGRLIADLDNRAGEWDHYARGSGAAGEALQPLAEVSAELGLVTAVGTERVEGRVFLLWQAGWRREADVNWQRLVCLSPWELFRIWRPTSTMVYSSKTLQFVIEDLVFRVSGLECEFDGSSEWSQTYSYLAVVPPHESGPGNRWLEDRLGLDETEEVPLVISSAQNGASVMRRLLDLVGGAARWGAGDSLRKLYLWIPDQEGDSPTANHTYQSAEILRGAYYRSFQWPNYAVARGESVLAVDWQEEDAGSIGSGDVQQVLPAVLWSEAWTTAGEVENAVAAALDDGMAKKWSGYIDTFPNAGLELADFVAVVDPHAGGGSVINDTYRVIGLRTTYEPYKRVWGERVYFEEV